MSIERVVPLEKYMEFSTIMDGMEPKKDILNDESDYFVGINNDVNKWELIEDTTNFKNYTAIFRVLNCVPCNNQYQYILRVLKSNIKEEVDFEEEKRYLESIVDMEMPLEWFSKYVH